MSAFLQILRSFGLLVARCALGATLIAHAWMRWDERSIPTEVAYVHQFGTPYPQVAAWGGTILEMVGGIFLIAGALTPLVAAAVLVEQILIISYTNWFHGPYLLNADRSYNGGYEYNVALAALALIFVLFGAGGASVDRLFRKKKAVEDEDESPTLVGGTPVVSGPPTGPRPITPGAPPRPTTPVGSGSGAGGVGATR